MINDDITEVISKMIDSYNSDANGPDKIKSVKQSELVNIRKMLIMSNYKALKYLKNPTDEEIQLAVDSDPHAIEYVPIDKRTDDMWRTVMAIPYEEMENHPIKDALRIVFGELHVSDKFDHGYLWPFVEIFCVKPENMDILFHLLFDDCPNPTKDRLRIKYAEDYIFDKGSTGHSYFSKLTYEQQEDIDANRHELLLKYLPYADPMFFTFDNIFRYTDYEYMEFLGYCKISDFEKILDYLYKCVRMEIKISEEEVHPDRRPENDYKYIGIIRNPKAHLLFAINRVLWRCTKIDVWSKNKWCTNTLFDELYVVGILDDLSIITELNREYLPLVFHYHFKKSDINSYPACMWCINNFSDKEIEWLYGNSSTFQIFMSNRYPERIRKIHNNTNDDKKKKRKWFKLWNKNK